MSEYKFYLGIGPMSMEIVDAVNEYVYPQNTQMMFICSENQINRDGGYTGFTTQSFSQKLINSKIWKCRDHCGPGFFYKTEKECFDTIIDDINNNFNLIHIDNCWLEGEEKLQYTLKAIKLALSVNSDIKFEIGTEVNTVNNKLNPNKLKLYLEKILELTTPFFYVLETGSVVQGYNNSHAFDVCQQSLQILKDYSIKIKEHNADYIDGSEIAQRFSVVDGMNIAPQFGAVQTSTVLTEALLYGVDTTQFKNLVYQGNKWIKWKEEARDVDLDYATLLGGHYHFNSKEYKLLIDRLSKYTDITHIIKNNVKRIIDNYISSYWSNH